MANVTTYWFSHLLKTIMPDVVTPFCNYVVRLKQNIDLLVAAALSYLHSAGAFSVQSNRDQSSCEPTKTLPPCTAHLCYRGFISLVPNIV